MITVTLKAITTEGNIKYARRKVTPETLTKLENKLNQWEGNYKLIEITKD